jgi:hypothetical protein
MLYKKKEISLLKQYAYNTISCFKTAKVKPEHELDMCSLDKINDKTYPNDKKKSKNRNNKSLSSLFGKINYHTPVKYLTISDDNDAVFYNIEKEKNICMDSLLYKMKQIVKKHEDTIKNKEQERVDKILYDLNPWKFLRNRINLNTIIFDEFHHFNPFEIITIHHHHFREYRYMNFPKRDVKETLKECINRINEECWIKDWLLNQLEKSKELGKQDDNTMLQERLWWKYSDVIDYMKWASENVWRFKEKIYKINYFVMMEKHDKWLKTTKKGNPKDFQYFCDAEEERVWGRILTPEGLDYEGYKMQHCVGRGSYDDFHSEIFSLRNKKNIPFVTVEYKNEKIIQIRAQNNNHAGEYQKDIDKLILNI